MDRARLVDAGFTLDGPAGPVVARLDGMPLAIELAAARVETLGVAQLLDRIGDRFALLAAGDRLAPARQRSLEATVRWSYELLGEMEQRVFRVVSVFPGSFTLEGAEAVAGPGAGPAVLQLVDCSLLSPPRAGLDGRSRYVMLETLRAFGAVHLARQAGQVPGDIPGWIARMPSIFLTMALTEAEDLAAARHACAAGPARSRAAGDQGSMANLLTWMARLDLRAGRIQDATAPLREALQIAVRADMPLYVDDALDCCGYLCAATGRHLEAVTAWAAAAAFSRQQGIAGSPAKTRSRQESLGKARQVLGPARTRAAEERDAAMSLATAAEYALMLTAPDPPAAAAPGPGALSARERELVTLVARGRTDAQLYISIRTVRSHLDRIRDKTGCRRRADLTCLALSTGLV